LGDGSCVVLETVGAREDFALCGGEGLTDVAALHKSQLVGMFANQARDAKEDGGPITRCPPPPVAPITLLGEASGPIHVFDGGLRHSRERSAVGGINEKPLFPGRSADSFAADEQSLKRRFRPCGETGGHASRITGHSRDAPMGIPPASSWYIHAN